MWIVQCTVHYYGEWSFPLSNFREPFVSDQKLVSKLHFVLNKNKGQCCPKVPHFAHDISKNFRGLYPWTPIEGGDDPLPHPLPARRLAVPAGPQVPAFVITQFDPPLSNTFRGLWPYPLSCIHRPKMNFLHQHFQMLSHYIETDKQR